MPGDFKLVTKTGRRINVRPDTLDFRDRMFTPTLVEVPTRIDLESYRKYRVPVLDQGSEGACTGFGLATVVNYLMRKRTVIPDKINVSSHMLYFLAKRYDEWSGENYDGSSPRGAMKGWQKHGVCSQELWDKKKRLVVEVSEDAVTRPLGAYYRVNHKDLVAMHSALAEVGILYASAVVHSGWDDVNTDGFIKQQEEILGGHAFAIVAYDENGFWIQNSWGLEWGKSGFARISYDDWLTNGTDIWVARLGVPVILKEASSIDIRHSTKTSYKENKVTQALNYHIISLGNNGGLNPTGTYGNSEGDVKYLFKDYIPRITRNWKRKRIMLYAHGGLVDEASAVQRLADYLPTLIQTDIYPISFIWHSDYWSTLTYMLDDAVKRRRPEGFLDATKDFMLDRLDDVLEPIARNLTGKAQWDEMKENALNATLSQEGGVRITLKYLCEFMKNRSDVEVHVVGHSAGSIFHAPLIQLLTSDGKNGYGYAVNTCTLWAPACTLKLFKNTYLPAINKKKIGRFTLFTLTDKIEQDDHCANIYHKSLLYLVSNAFEEKARIPLINKDGEPLLGMEKFVKRDKEMMALFGNGMADWVLSPHANADPRKCSAALHHGDFDDDIATITATLARILNTDQIEAKFKFEHSASSLRKRRMNL